jgi:predicted ATPase/DNA-binding winged helix-turn-helix (wHTH) protein
MEWSRGGSQSISADRRGNLRAAEETEAVASRASRSFTFGPFVLVPERQTLLKNGEAVRLGGRALHLLTALVERAGELVGKSELIAEVWPGTSVDEGNLKVNMAALRRVIEAGPDAPQYIATVVGRGYRFVAPVQAKGAVELQVEASQPLTPSHNLPTSTMRIFGRAQAIVSLGTDLEQSQLVSIVGAGGIGKTTVALAVAQRALEGFAEGVWLVDLATLTDAERIPSAIAAVLGVEAHSPDMLAVLCAFLRNRQALLVLDSCEHLIEGVASCADRILASAAGVRILATSREPLRIAKERVRKLPGLETPPESHAMGARNALDFAAVQLFVERATDADSSFLLNDADAPIVGQICRKLDGLALAIELAATRVGTFGATGLLHQLDDRFRLLSGWRAGPERHRTLAATLDWSYGLLDEREAAMLRAVSVFAGAFDLEGAAAVFAENRFEVLDLLASLSAKSLLAVEPKGEGVTCRLLETMRVYALARLRSSGEEQVMRLRHAAHLCAVLERAKAEWAARPSRDWGAAYTPLLDDLRGALAWTALDPANRALLIRLTVAGILLWNHLSLTQECRTHVARALAELPGTELVDSATEMRLQMSLAGSTMFTRGLVPEVLAALLRTRDIAVRLGDIDHQLSSLRMMGSYQSFICELEPALATLEKFAVVAAEHDPSALRDGETHVGITELHAGRLENARRRLERLHRRTTASVEEPRLARFLHDHAVDVGIVLCYAEWLTGSPDTAAHTAEATLAQSLKTKHALSLSNALAVGACPVFFLSRRYEECARYAAMLDDTVREHGILIWSPTARFYRGALACARPDVPAHGIEELLGAVAEFRAINHWARMSWILAVLADALARGGRLSEAAVTIAEALEWGRQHAELWCLPEVLRIQASILKAQNRTKEAEAVLVEAIAVASDIAALSWRLRAANDLAELLLASSRGSEAHEILQPIFSAFTEGFATRDLVVASERLAAASLSKRKTS